jgi:hypothetical protein
VSVARVVVLGWAGRGAVDVCGRAVDPKGDEGEGERGERRER